MTVTDKGDIQAALEELVHTADKMVSSGGPGNRQSLQHVLPPLRLQLVKVASQGDVPKPPADEVAQLEQMQQARRLLQAQAMGQQNKAVRLFPSPSTSPWVFRAKSAKFPLTWYLNPLVMGRFVHPEASRLVQDFGCKHRRREASFRSFPNFGDRKD